MFKIFQPTVHLILSTTRLQIKHTQMSLKPQPAIQVMDGWVTHSQQEWLYRSLSIARVKVGPCFESHRIFILCHRNICLLWDFVIAIQLANHPSIHILNHY